MAHLPTLFISHGSPMLAIQTSPAHQFLLELGKQLPRPRAIVVASAHWESTDEAVVASADKPATIHDFGGFPQQLFEIDYPAPGAPEAATRAASLLQQAGFRVRTDANRGLDHGAWVPLSLLYPDADIPVTQVSVLRDAAPAYHLQMGRALSALAEDSILVLGSGSLTHNLHEYRGQAIDSPAPVWVTDFGEWMRARLEQNDSQALLDYRQLAPFAVRNHPTEEHLLPLFVAMGAAGSSGRGRRLHSSYEYGVLAMDIYAFE